MKINKKVAVVSTAIILVSGAAGAGFWLFNDSSKQSDDTRQVQNNSSGQNNSAGEVQTISGTITQVHTDCGKVRYLDENGEVVTSGPAGCDAGSFIEIDDTQRIHTSSGEASREYAFNKHNEEWRPGDEVILIVLEGENGNYTLHCDECGED